MNITSKDLQDLVDCRIVELHGISGVDADVDLARCAPSLIQMHAMSGLVFDIAEYDKATDTFTMEEVRWTD